MIANRYFGAINLPKWSTWFRQVTKLRKKAIVSHHRNLHRTSTEHNTLAFNAHPRTGAATSKRTSYSEHNPDTY